MKRRSFLRGAAAVMPAAAVPELLLAEALGQAAAPGSGELHVVGASEDRFGHAQPGIQHVLFQGVGGGHGRAAVPDGASADEGWGRSERSSSLEPG